MIISNNQYKINNYNQVNLKKFSILFLTINLSVIILRIESKLLISALSKPFATATALRPTPAGAASEPPCAGRSVVGDQLRQAARRGRWRSRCC